MVNVMFTKMFDTAQEEGRLKSEIHYTAKDTNHKGYGQDSVSLIDHSSFIQYGRMVWLTKSLGCDSTFGTWISYPVIVLQCMHSLKDSWYTLHSRVDLCVSQELSGQVWVKACLDGSRSVDPQCWVEEHMVQQLPCQEWEAEQLHLNWCASPLSTVIKVLRVS